MKYKGEFTWTYPNAGEFLWELKERKESGIDEYLYGIEGETYSLDEAIEKFDGILNGCFKVTFFK